MNISEFMKGFLSQPVFMSKKNQALVCLLIGKHKATTIPNT